MVSPSEEDHSERREASRESNTKQSIDQLIEERSQYRARSGTINTGVQERPPVLSMPQLHRRPPDFSGRAPVSFQGGFSQSFSHYSHIYDPAFQVSQLASAASTHPSAYWVVPMNAPDQYPGETWFGPSHVYPPAGNLSQPEVLYHSASQPFHTSSQQYQLGYLPQYLPAQQSVPSGYAIPFQLHAGQPFYYPTEAALQGSESNPPAIPESTGRRSPRMRPFSGEVVARGPPRRPKQSGYALWIGNLPPAASIVDLKEHFSRGARDDIESVKLIAKTNCAFVNYKTPEACLTACDRFHESNFYDRRLVCRPRKGSVADDSGLRRWQKRDAVNDQQSATASAQDEDQSARSSPGSETTAQRQQRMNLPERFFILKSLTVEDLEMSCRDGVWATQPHNESILNNAYLNSVRVYLFFSVNRSSEYYGYGLMTSEIGKVERADSAEGDARPERPAIQSGTTQGLPASNLGDTGGLRCTITHGDGSAPRGLIIDDIARGIIFWEAVSDEDEPSASADANPGQPSQSVLPDGPVVVSSTSSSAREVSAAKHTRQSGSGLFGVQWMSTNRVPFHRTRGIRNPWNSNREVKIARDGTEVETHVAHHLLAMFHTPSPGYPAQR